MALMQYKAMDVRGRITTGQMEAVNAADLEMRLERMGLDLVSSRETKVKAASLNSRLAKRELINFCFQLEQLVSAGVPIVEALADLRDSVDDRRLREVVVGMVESIEGGKTLSESMHDYPGVFDDVFVNLVHAGELSGQVGPVLSRVTENLKWQDEQASQIKRLMMYPIFVLLAVVIAAGVLLGYLVPELAAFMRNMGQELPMHTQILFDLSKLVRSFWYIILLLPVAVTIAISALAKASPGFQYFLDGVKLRLPVFGPIIRKLILARFCTYFALMYSSGITVLECVRICESLVGNKVVADATNRAGRQIADGASISAGFESTGLFPPLVLRMLRVGESTGALDTALANISYFYERDVQDAIGKMQQMIGPALTLLLGGLIAWIIVSVFGPLYDLLTQLDF